MEMFRTKDINLMTINEVYIGGIYGLNTRTMILHRHAMSYVLIKDC